MKSLLLSLSALFISLLSFSQESQFLDGNIGTYKNENGVSFELVHLADDRLSSGFTPPIASFYYIYESNTYKVEGFGSYNEGDKIWQFFDKKTSTQIGTGKLTAPSFELTFKNAEKQVVTKKGIPSELIATTNEATAPKTEVKTSTLPNLEGYKLVLNTDLDGMGKARSFENYQLSSYTGKDNSLFEVYREPKTKSDNRGDYEVFVFKMTLISAATKEYSLISGTFRGYLAGDSDTYTTWSEINGCKYTFQHFETSWSVSIDQSGKTCLGSDALKAVLSEKFVHSF